MTTSLIKLDDYLVPTVRVFDREREIDAASYQMTLAGLRAVSVSDCRVLYFVTNLHSLGVSGLYL